MEYSILDIHYPFHNVKCFANIVPRNNTIDLPINKVPRYDCLTTTYIIIKECIFILIYKCNK